jgi:DNA replication protein DnaC
MSRVTRSATKVVEDVKENVAINNIQPKVTPKKNKRRLVIVDSSTDESPSPKSSRSNSMSPLTEKFADKLSLAKPKSQFQSVRRALADNSEFRLPGREKEFEELTSFLDNIMDSEGSGSLYISGAPGTGSKLKF